MKANRILLIQPRGVSLEEKVYSYGWCPPLGLLAIASYIKEKYPHIEILDETLGQVQNNLEADVLGLSCNLANYERALQIAQSFKERNPKGKIVIGGPHSVLGENILRNRQFIDAIVYGSDGEGSFLDYIGGKDLAEIPNLIWKKNNEIITNPEEPLDLTKLPIPNRGFINIEKYFQKFQDSKFLRPTAIYTTKGCPHGKCTFCIFSNQKYPRFRTKNFKQVWQEIRYLQDDLKVDYVWIVSDSPTKEWFLNLFKTKPKELHIAFRFYGRSKEIDEKTAEVLRELNTYEVFLGIESGDDEILRKMQKGETIQHHLNAVKNLVKYNIKPRTAFVLGAEGETEETLEKSQEFAKKLLDLGADSIACSIFTPVPKSRAYQKLLEIKEFKQKYSKEDLLSPSQLQKEWIKYFTSVDYQTIKYFIEEFKQLSPKWGGVFLT